MLSSTVNFVAALLALHTAASPLGARDSKHDDSLFYVTFEEHWISPAFSDPSLATWGPELTRQAAPPPAVVNEIGQPHPQASHLARKHPPCARAPWYCCKRQ